MKNPDKLKQIKYFSYGMDYFDNGEEYWYLQDYKLRPFKIVGYIDGLLNKTKLTGIGELNFLGANELILDKELSGYTIMYAAVHGSDDLIPAEG